MQKHHWLVIIGVFVVAYIIGAKWPAIAAPITNHIP